MSNPQAANSNTRHSVSSVGVPLMLIRHAQKHRNRRANLTVVADGS